MKHILCCLTAAACLLPTNILAQQPTTFEKGKVSKWSCTVALNSVQAQMDQKLFDTWVYGSANYFAYFGDKKDKSYSFSLIPKYKISSDFLLRFEFGFTNINLSSYYNGGGDTLIGTGNGNVGGTASIIKIDTIQQKIYRVCAGAQWNIINVKFMEFYCGASINYLNYAKLYWSDYIVALGFPNNARYTNYRATTPGGFATGLGLLAGVNVYVGKRISIGGELSYSFLYSKLGGKQEGTRENGYPDPANNFTESWIIHNNSSEGMQFSEIMPSINFSVLF